jgi:hypothetical protein
MRSTIVTISLLIATLVHIDSAHFIVGVDQHYVDVWHGNDDGGINIRLNDQTCVGHSISQGFYLDRAC